MADDGRQIEQSYFIGASPKKVFRALTEPKRLRRWMLSDAELELKPGARYRFVWPGGHRHTGEVRAFVPGRSVTLTWPQGSSRRRLGTTEVRFDLRRKLGGTVLSLTHSGFGRGEEWVSTYALTSSGWAYYLMNLKSVLEHRRDLRRDADQF